MKAVFLAFQVKSGLPILKLANAPSLSFGTDSLVLRLILALVAKFGMFTPTAVNALILPIGQEKNVNICLSALLDKPSTVNSNAHALTDISGVKISAFTHPAQVDKSGLVQSACALLVLITTEECALSASTVKNGIPKLQLAHVNQVSSGMDNFVKNPTAVQMVECGALSTTNVFAPMDPTGVATTACLSRNVMVDNISTLP